MSAKRYRYTGKEKDEETGLSYHQARYLMTWLGRWDRPDPIGLGGGANRLVYAGSSPVGRADQMGTDWWSEADQAVSAGAAELERRGEVALSAGESFLDEQLASAETAYAHWSAGVGLIAKDTVGSAEEVILEGTPVGLAYQGRYGDAASAYVENALSPAMLAASVAESAHNASTAWYQGPANAIDIMSGDADLAARGIESQVTLGADAAKTGLLLWGAGAVSRGSGLLTAESAMAEAQAAEALLVEPVLIATDAGVLEATAVELLGATTGASASEIIIVGSSEVATEALLAGELTAVSRWGRAGLAGGDWVMQGEASLTNYLLSGKWQPSGGGALGNQYAAFGAGESYVVPRSALGGVPAEFGGCTRARSTRPGQPRLLRLGNDAADALA